MKKIKKQKDVNIVPPKDKVDTDIAINTILIRFNEAWERLANN